MTISKDRVKPSPMPDSWKLREIFATGIVLGSYMALMTVVFFWIMKDTDFFSVIIYILCFPQYYYHQIAKIVTTMNVTSSIAGQVRCEVYKEQPRRNDGSPVPTSQYHKSSTNFCHKVPQLVLCWKTWSSSTECFYDCTTGNLETPISNQVHVVICLFLFWSYDWSSVMSLCFVKNLVSMILHLSLPPHPPLKK